MTAPSDGPPGTLPAVIAPPIGGELASVLSVLSGVAVPGVIADLGDQAAWRYVEFFTANIRNPNTRRAYARACARFSAGARAESWCWPRSAHTTSPAMSKCYRVTVRRQT